MYPVETLIVGAGPAGLACGACLSRAGQRFVILERQDAVGASWRGHYERLHLHTERRLSNLPHLAMPDHYPKYPSRRQVVEYLERYAAHFALRPRFGQSVQRAGRYDQTLREGEQSDAEAPGRSGNSIHRSARRWIVETADTRWVTRNLVIATGYNAVPIRPEFPGEGRFRGEVMHSAEYDNGSRWRGKRVLVVGCGNSGGEIALDLIEYGAEVTWVVRGPVYVARRDVFGRSAQRMALLMARLPLPMADAVATSLQRIIIGDLSRHGIHRPELGMYTMIRRHGRIPILDVGTIDMVKRGRITVVPGIERFTETGVELVDGRALPFDLVVLATGFRSGLHAFLDCADDVTDRRGYPVAHGRESAIPGLYFIGFTNPSTGALREMGFEGERIAAAIAGDRRQARSIQVISAMRAVAARL